MWFSVALIDAAVLGSLFNTFKSILGEQRVNDQLKHRLQFLVTHTNVWVFLRHLFLFLLTKHKCAFQMSWRILAARAKPEKAWQEHLAVLSAQAVSPSRLDPNCCIVGS